jgi:hypothetical protein
MEPTMREALLHISRPMQVLKNVVRREIGF